VDVDRLLLISELLIGGCLFIAGTFLGAIFTRRRLIARGTPLTVCALREPGDRRWRFGLVHYGTNGLEWFTLAGWSLRPAKQWEREFLEIGVCQTIDPRERPEILISSAARVDCRHREAMFELALARASCTALRSWLEAAPPGHNVNVT
jgi:hypothetical protein